MPSRERSLWAAVALVLTGALFAGLAAWSLVARSTIPSEVSGTVTEIELRREKHPGVDDVWMVAVDDGRPRHVDRDVARLLTVGAEVRKDAWATTIVVDDVGHQLSLSDDARSMLLLAPVLAVLVAGLTIFIARGRRSVEQDD